MSVVVIIVVVAIALVAFLMFRGKASPQLPSQTLSDTPESEQAKPAAIAPAKKPKSEPKLAEAPKQDELATGAVTAEAESRPIDQAAVQPQPIIEAAPPSLRTQRDVDGLRRGLDKSRRPEGFFGRIAALLRGKKEISADIATQIEDVLLTSDVGVQTTQAIVDRIRESLSHKELSDPEIVWDALRSEARRILNANSQQATIATRVKPTVILLVGVNGAGKTSSPLASRRKERQSCSQPATRSVRRQCSS
jgi:fused signal recognition particle receptor